MPDPTAPGLANLAYLEDAYQAYLASPAAVSPELAAYFDGLTGRSGELGLLASAGGDPDSSRCEDCGGFLRADMAARQERVGQLVRAFRVRGHLAAALDPLGRARPEVPELDYAFHGLTDEDLDRPFASRTVGGLPNAPTLRALVSHLKDTYCRRIGVQFMHMDALEPKAWLQARMERTGNRLSLSREAQLKLLTWLTDAVIFEAFLHRRYVGAKRFSLEGAESLMPLLHLAVEKAGDQGLSDVVIGMAHRGRINVLANLLGKSARQIFREFDDSDPEAYEGRGDVKYHLGHEGTYACPSGRELSLALCFNPSHLEFVGPVALGRARARAARSGTGSLAILIHGDAAFAGQGVVQETLNLSELPGYSVGGALHVVINNQIGFTTSPEEGRSSLYATDVARLLQIPIFHVNGEDPEAVAQVVALAMDFRAEFQRDVVIDMYGYRRYGHNEGDEPAFTQPLMYEAIRQRKSLRDGYLEHLLALGGVSQADADALAEARRAHLEAELSLARSPRYARPDLHPGPVWLPFVGGPDATCPEVDTGVDAPTLKALLIGLNQLPEGFSLHPKLTRVLEARQRMADATLPVDWATAEALALGSLSREGHRVRLTGQDSGRGTFSHRHAVLVDQRTGARALPLASVGTAPLELHNSPLSEVAVLGFEYGFSLECPDALVAWEAQFGDFVNVAQVIVDQFLASAEDKWNRLSGLTLLLPHGFEGQGPEHSSARVERFLMLLAEDNLQVVIPSTAAQLFHVLRRQVKRRWRKPLIVLTPKSLLRSPALASPLEALAEGRFVRCLPDPGNPAPEGVRVVLVASGKVAHELALARAERPDVALLRLEQVAPLDVEGLTQAIARFPHAAEVRFVQEEPANMGPSPYLRLTLGTQLGAWPLSFISRPASASPATGSAQSHQREQAKLLARALA